MSVERLRRHPGYLVLQLSKQARRISTTVSRNGLSARTGVAAEIDDLLFEGLTAAERDQLAELLPKACAHHEARR